MQVTVIWTSESFSYIRKREGNKEVVTYPDHKAFIERYHKDDETHKLRTKKFGLDYKRYSYFI